MHMLGANTSRSDPQYSVRNESLHVWKSVVHNTPKTLSAMMSKLMDQVRMRDGAPAIWWASWCMAQDCVSHGDESRGRAWMHKASGACCWATEPSCCCCCCCCCWRS